VLGHPYGPSSQRGIFRSTDGGKSWSRILYLNDDTGGSSVKLDPHDSNVLYASLWNVRSGPWEDNNVFNGTAGGLYKSTDGGDHWRRLSNGLPGNLSQIEVAVAPSQPGRLYATVATNGDGKYGSAAGLGVFRSNDSGETWFRVTTDPRPALRIGGGDLPIIKVDPRDADVLYSASIVTVKSTDGGVHWMSWHGSPGGDDYQNLWINPDDPRRIALAGDQGGIITVNGGESWSSWLNQPTAQLYHVGIVDTFPYRICSGQQESGSVCIASRGDDGEVTLREWHPAGLIEYGYAVPDPLDLDVVYGSGRNVVTRTQLSTGQVQNISPIPLDRADSRVDRTEPLFFSPQDPHHMYYAANRLYESDDGGLHWQVASPDLTRDDPGVPASVGALHVAKADKQRGAIYAASASSIQEGLIWVGTDDGLIWVTHDGGRNWQNVTPPALTSWSKVTQLEASHFDPLVAYAAVSRFRIDDRKPYVYRTGDGGLTWTAVTAGLPVDAPVNTVREDPMRRGLLFAGTESNVWLSFDEGEHWSSLQLNLPHTSMRDLVIHGSDLVLATHGRSFWVLDDISPLRQFSPSLSTSEATLLRPSTATRVTRSTGTDTPLQPDEPAGRNPPNGAVIDYYLARDASQPVSLEVLDQRGELAARVSSTDAATFTAEQLQRELIPSYWIRMEPPLATSAGMHRWVWDLHYPAPRTLQRGFPISAVPGDTPLEPSGPLALPGSYRVRLCIGDHQWQTVLTVRPDPRLKATDADLSAQFELARQLAAGLGNSTGALQEALSLRSQVQALNAPLSPPLSTRLKSLDARIGELVEPVESGPLAASGRGLQKLNDDLAALYAQVNAADAAPTQVQAAQTILALKELQALGSARQALHAQVLALNRELHRAHITQLRSELPPPRDRDFADER